MTTLVCALEELGRQVSSRTVPHSRRRSRARTQRSFAWGRIPVRCATQSFAPYRRLHGRVRGSSPPQQLECCVLVFERQWSRPNGTKPACLRTLQGSGRECTTRGGFSSRLHLSARVHLSHRTAKGTEFQLPPVANDLPRLSGGVSEPGDSGRRTGPGHARCCLGNSGAREPDFREP